MVISKGKINYAFWITVILDFEKENSWFSMRNRLLGSPKSNCHACRLRIGILFNDPKSIRFGYPAFIFHLSNDYQFDIAQNVFLFILKTKR